MPSLRERRRSARLPSRPDAERYVHTVRDLMFPMGDIEVGIGGSLMSPQWPNRSIFAPSGRSTCRCPTQHPHFS